MTEWLVRILTVVRLHRHVLLRVWVSSRRRRGTTSIRRTVLVRSADTLVRVRSLLGHDAVAAAVAVVRRASGTAARAEQPEESSSECKRSCEPCSDVNVLAHGPVEAVLFQIGVEYTRIHGEQGGGSNRGCGSEQECNARDQAGDETAHAAADSEKTNKQLKPSGSKSNDISNRHPLGDSFVCLDSVLEAGGENVVDGAAVGAAVQAPDSNRVERKLDLGLGAVVDFIFAVAGLVASTVAPEADVVEVADIAGSLGGFQGGFEGAVGVAAGEAGDGAFGGRQERAARDGQVAEIGLVKLA